jgi:hypothetical protein
MLRDGIASIVLALALVMAAHLFVRAVRAVPLTDAELKTPIEELLAP